MIILLSIQPCFPPKGAYITTKNLVWTVSAVGNLLHLRSCNVFVIKCPFSLFFSMWQSPQVNGTNREECSGGQNIAGVRAMHLQGVLPLNPCMGRVSTAGAGLLLLVKGIVALEDHHPFHSVGFPGTQNLFCWWSFQYFLKLTLLKYKLYTISRTHLKQVNWQVSAYVNYHQTSWTIKRLKFL